MFVKIMILGRTLPQHAVGATCVPSPVGRATSRDKKNSPKSQLSEKNCGRKNFEFALFGLEAIPG